ncbi:hypothetical protein GF373_16010 [bacterium]|nr:hypothetical protein [bacterium]
MDMKPSVFIQTVCFGIVLLGFWMGNPAVVRADLIELNDGTSLRCKVMNEVRSKETGIRYLQIQVNGSQVWVNREFVSRVRKSPQDQEAAAGIHARVQQLIREGKLVPELQKQLDFAAPPKQEATAIPFRAQSVKGWAYLYEDMEAVTNRERSPLKEGNSVPPGYILILSPNTHVTLNVGDIGRIGLEGGAHVRFDEMTMDPSTQSYQADLWLREGKGWISIDKPKSSWKRVKLTMNAVRSVLQSATLYLQATEETGGLRITFLEGANKLHFWRGNEEPYMAQVGQTVVVSPGSSRLPTEPTANLVELRQIINTWDRWSPEEFVVDLEEEIPPFRTFPTFGVMPALHSYEIPIDQTITYPPELRSMGEIIAEYKQAIDRYKYDTGKYPASRHGLNALRESHDVAGWRGPYVALDLPKKDLWGEAYVYELYRHRGKEYPDVRSKGPNKKDDRGLGDDIR